MLAHPTKGKIVRVEGTTVVFKPAESTYELHLLADGAVEASDAPVELVLSGEARKAYTVPSGGLFVSPIMGPTRILQGRVKAADEESITLQCGVLINVKLSSEPGALELARGPIAVGSLVNVILQPGLRCQMPVQV